MVVEWSECESGLEGGGFEAGCCLFEGFDGVAGDGDESEVGDFGEAGDEFFFSFFDGCEVSSGFGGDSAACFDFVFGVSVDACEFSVDAFVGDLSLIHI